MTIQTMRGVPLQGSGLVRYWKEKIAGTIFDKDRGTDWLLISGGDIYENTTIINYHSPVSYHPNIVRPILVNRVCHISKNIITSGIELISVGNENWGSPP